jgi:hypothetical protein
MLAHILGASYTVMVTGAFCVAGSIWFTLELPKVKAAMHPRVQEAIVETEPPPAPGVHLVADLEESVK